VRHAARADKYGHELASRTDGHLATAYT